ncbi:venom metalloproteinase antarease TserMP_A-like [Ornithodoros turicata]|uniref:venom metalloproteinase antarease TserMP_A-like n=1 Tax=Ornithodoros turicata TaxID=34597 RepID=UPI00313A1527
MLELNCSSDDVHQLIWRLSAVNCACSYEYQETVHCQYVVSGIEPPISAITVGTKFMSYHALEKQESNSSNKGTSTCVGGRAVEQLRPAPGQQDGAVRKSCAFISVPGTLDGQPCLRIRISELAAVQSEEAIVYPEFLEERSDSGVRTLKIKDDLTLSLVQKSPFPERLHLRTPQQDGSVLNTYVSSSLYSSKLFQDEDNFASLVVTDDNGLHLQGMIRDDLRIEPLPTAERSSEGLVAHRLYKVEEVRSDTPIYQYVSAPASNRAAHSLDKMIEGRIDKRFARPETHIVVDSVLFAEFAKNETDVILYLGAAVNAVNLRYKTVKTLDVEIVAVGFTFYENGNEERHFLKFVQGASWDQQYGVMGTTLIAFMYFYKNNHPDTFYGADLLSFVTGRDMCALEGNRFTCAVTGLGYTGGVCSDARVSLIEDTAWSFRLVRGLAHELAHSLGCVHDGQRPATFMEGHPGAERCHWRDGYLMSYIRENNRQFEFSRCCAEQIYYVSQREDKLCLFYNNTGKSDRVETDALPGEPLYRRLSLDRLCQLAFRDNTYMFNKEAGFSGNGCKVPCRSRQFIWGLNTSWRSGEADRHDGSPCDSKDKNKRCIRGECQLHKPCKKCHNRQSQPEAPPARRKQ